MLSEQQKNIFYKTPPSIHSPRLRPFFIDNIVEGYENTVMGACSYGDKELKLIHTGVIGEKDIVEKFESNFKSENSEEENEYKAIIEYLKPIDDLYDEVFVSHKANLIELCKEQLPLMMDYYEKRISQEINETGVHEIATNRHFIYLLIKLLKTSEFNKQLQGFDKLYIDYFKANPTKLKIWDDWYAIEPDIFDNSYWWWHLDKLNDLTEKELSTK